MTKAQITAANSAAHKIEISRTAEILNCPGRKYITAAEYVGIRKEMVAAWKAAAWKAA